MVREVMWSAWEEPGLEHLHLAVRESGITADSLVLGNADYDNSTTLQRKLCARLI